MLHIVKLIAVLPLTMRLSSDEEPVLRRISISGGRRSGRVVTRCARSFQNCGMLIVGSFPLRQEYQK